MESEPILKEDACDNDLERETYSEFSPKPCLASYHLTRGRCFRLSLLALVTVGLLGAGLVWKANQLFESSVDGYTKSARVKDVISLVRLPPDAGSNGCVPGTVCVCDQAGKRSCVSWTFEVGDVLIFQFMPSTTIPMGVANLFMQALWKGAVHAAIVTEVRGPALTDIVVTEAMKAPHNKVFSSTMDHLLGRSLYHGLWIRRVDRARFPNFVNHFNDIATWAHAHVGEPFDMALMIEKAVPFPWRWTDPHWIEALPGCEGRAKALNLYHRGGPGKWFCSEFVAWTLAFPGGLNTDYGDKGACATPPWDAHVEYLEVAPGDLVDQPFYDTSGVFVSCSDSYPCAFGIGV